MNRGRMRRREGEIERQRERERERIKRYKDVDRDKLCLNGPSKAPVAKWMLSPKVRGQ